MEEERHTRWWYRFVSLEYFPEQLKNIDYIFPRPSPDSPWISQHIFFFLLFLSDSLEDTGSESQFCHLWVMWSWTGDLTSVSPSHNSTHMYYSDPGRKQMAHSKWVTEESLIMRLTMKVRAGLGKLQRAQHLRTRKSREPLPSLDLTGHREEVRSYNLGRKAIGGMCQKGSGVCSKKDATNTWPLAVE